MEALCNNCRFWARGKTSGECRIRAPSMIERCETEFSYAVWPITEVHDFCGEHQFKDSDIPKQPDPANDNPICDSCGRRDYTPGPLAPGWREWFPNLGTRHVSCPKRRCIEAVTVLVQSLSPSPPHHA